MILAVLVAALLAAPAALAAGPDAAGSTEAQTILHVLDYVAVDYAGAVADGRILDQGEYEEQLDFVRQARALLGRLPSRPVAAALASQADELIALVKDRRPAPEVAALAQRLRSAIIEAYDVAVAPARPPDLSVAAPLYAAQCAACHGAEGRGDGPAARGLAPPPASFHDRDRLARQSVYALYSTITLGVERTAMASYRALPEDQRWSLAFHVASLGASAAEIARGAELWEGGAGRALLSDLASLTTLTEREARARGGDVLVSIVAYLRTRPDAITAGEDPIALTARLLRESLAEYRRGRARAAHDLAMTGYLRGFEVVEPALAAIDLHLKRAIEAEMLRYRTMLRAGEPAAAVEAQVRVISSLLDGASRRLRSGGGPPPTAVFTHAVLIFRGKALVALLILVPIVTLLVKTDQRDALSDLRAGGAAALGLGAITVLLASSVVTLTGTTHAVAEGATAVIGALVLLAAGLRLYSMAARHVVAEGRSASARWALALVAFLAVYRLAFEMAYFAQSLWLQSGAHGRVALVAGFAVSATGLGALGWLLVRGGRRLPRAILSGATPLVLAGVMLVYAGKGVATLQRVGVVPATAVAGPSFPMIGLFPNAQGLALQAALLVVMAGGVLSIRRAARQTP
jgi:high-affinity iron transporter